MIWRWSVLVWKMLWVPIQVFNYRSETYSDWTFRSEERRVVNLSTTTNKFRLRLETYCIPIFLYPSNSLNKNSNTVAVSIIKNLNGYSKHFSHKNWPPPDHSWSSLSKHCTHNHLSWFSDSVLQIFCWAT